MEGWLGDYISREAEADLGPDQDTPRNNILRNSVTGAVGDVADNDRADDGWRNRALRFFNCERTQLDVRVSKSPTATLNFMYLNVWFDGNRDGDWGDLGQCPAEEDQPAQASYEWIVQNYIVDMSAIPAGGSLDFNVLTEKVLKTASVAIDFSLSEAPANQPASGTDLPDGRGPIRCTTLRHLNMAKLKRSATSTPRRGWHTASQACHRRQRANRMDRLCDLRNPSAPEWWHTAHASATARRVALPAHCLSNHQWWAD
jgi:hypothetical protein